MGGVNTVARLRLGHGKKGGACVLLIKLFPQLYTIIALKQQKLLVAHDKLAHFEGVQYVQKFI